MSNTITPTVSIARLTWKGWKSSIAKPVPGQVFYESPEDVHTVSRNVSKAKPAKFVEFFIKNVGAPILTPVH